MPGPEDLNQPPPIESHVILPEFFRNYDVVPGTDIPEHRVGVFRLDIPEPTMLSWISGLRSKLPHTELGLYQSQGPDEATQTETFVVTKKPTGVNIQLRGLQGLSTPVTLVIEPDNTRICIPFNMQPEGEDAKSAVVQLGKDYWMGLPKQVRKYINTHPAVRPKRGSVSQAEQEPYELDKLDPEIGRRIEDLMIGYDGIATPKEIKGALGRLFPGEKLPSEVDKNLDRIIQLMSAKLRNPRPL